MPRAASTLAILLLAGALAPGAAAQHLIVTCTVEGSAGTAAPLEFGLTLTAQDGIDADDEPLPPPAPDQALLAYLQMVDPPAPLPNRWRRDIRPFALAVGTVSELWAMTVEVDSAGGTFVFDTAVDIHEPGPYVLFIRLPDGVRERVAPGSTIEVPCTAPITTFFWELQYDEGVPEGRTPFGALKALYR